MAFCARTLDAYARSSITANGLVTTNVKAATAPATANWPVADTIRRRVEPSAARYHVAATNGAAINMALNFEPTANPAKMPAPIQTNQPPPSARRAASATVATTQNVSTTSTA